MATFYAVIVGVRDWGGGHEEVAGVRVIEAVAAAPAASYEAVAGLGCRASPVERIPLQKTRQIYDRETRAISPQNHTTCSVPPRYEERTPFHLGQTNDEGICCGWRQ